MNSRVRFWPLAALLIGFAISWSGQAAAQPSPAGYIVYKETTDAPASAYLGTVYYAMTLDRSGILPWKVYDVGADKPLRLIVEHVVQDISMSDLFRKDFVSDDELHQGLALQDRLRAAVTQSPQLKASAFVAFQAIQDEVDHYRQKQVRYRGRWMALDDYAAVSTRDNQRMAEAAAARQEAIAEENRRRQLQRLVQIPENDRMSLSDRAARWKTAVVKVLIQTQDGAGHGTGFFIAPGLVLTNWHVVDGAQKIDIVLEEDGSSHPGRVQAQRELPDVALVQIDWTENNYFPLGSSDTCRELDEVVMIGYPAFDNFSATYVKGSISSPKRNLQGYDCMQLDIRSNRGNSGGPIINLNGQVVGIQTFGFQNIDPTLAQFTFAQQINSVFAFLKQNAAGQFFYTGP